MRRSNIKWMIYIGNSNHLLVLMKYNFSVSTIWSRHTVFPFFSAELTPYFSRSISGKEHWLYQKSAFCEYSKNVEELLIEDVMLKKEYNLSSYHSYKCLKMYNSLSVCGDDAMGWRVSMSYFGYISMFSSASGLIFIPGRKTGWMAMPQNNYQLIYSHDDLYKCTPSNFSLLICVCKCVLSISNAPAVAKGCVKKQGWLDTTYSCPESTPLPWSANTDANLMCLFPFLKQMHFA